MKFFDRFKAKAPPQPSGDFQFENAEVIAVHRHNLTKLAELWENEAEEAERAGNEQRAQDARINAGAARVLVDGSVAFYSKWKLRE